MQHRQAPFVLLCVVIATGCVSPFPGPTLEYPPRPVAPARWLYHAELPAAEQLAKGMYRLHGGGFGFIDRDGHLAAIDHKGVGVVDDSVAADHLCVAKDGLATTFVDGNRVKKSPRFGGEATDMGAFVDLVAGAIIYESKGKTESLACDNHPGGEASLVVPDLAAARLIASYGHVAPSEHTGQLLVYRGGESTRREISGLSKCFPVGANEAYFHCRRGTSSVFVRIDSHGEPHEEHVFVADNARNDLRDSIDVTTSDMLASADGGVAAWGSCSGKQNHATCVRQPDGSWKTVVASGRLRREAVLYHPLRQDGPSPHVVPTPNGAVMGLYARKHDHRVRIITRVDNYYPIQLKRLAGWILESYDTWHRSAWTTTDKAMRVWPIKRKHPRTDRAQFCSVEISTNGSFRSTCMHGKVYAVGRMGIWESSEGSFYETINAGRTWNFIVPPSGWDAAGNSVECIAIGCRFGVFFRYGWGLQEYGKSYVPKRTT